MPDVKQAVEGLRGTIAGVIANLEVWSSLDYVRDALGLPMVDSSGLSKYNYLRTVTAAATDDEVVNAAKQMLHTYPGFRGKPPESNLQYIQNNLWWVESQGAQRISSVTRYRIAESLEGVHFWGRFNLREFFAPVLPGTEIPFRVGNDGLLYQESASSLTDAFSRGFLSDPTQVSRISTVDLLQGLGLAEWPDQRFCLLVERIVHPEVQPPEILRHLVVQFAEMLQHDGFELRQEDLQGGVAVYRVRRRTAGVVGSPKYIIFASTGPKPDIVIDDAVSMNIRVVRYADQCLIYDQPPPNSDLTWEMLVEWWCKLRGTNINDADMRRDIGHRLQASLQSDPERFLFDTYFKVFRPKLGAGLPALLPQVYLHYDPRSIRERREPVLVRQRMDFLMLLRNAARIVIEIDGVQHYADEDGRASPRRYAEMVAEDRRIRALGYEVYRFGGAEFVVPERAIKSISTFFEELFARHGIQPASKDGMQNGAGA
jgi:very-short-patch-repair endonuclease